MATHLQQLLRSLCFGSEWNYSVFWKLKHCARMVLAWEDAYYSSPGKHDSLVNKCFSEALESLHDGRFPHDPLQLAVTKMSYHVYSLGEGIIGQVAVTGKHRWIFADDHAIESCSSSEASAFQHGDGWQAQFLAGIQTVVAVAVVPHGVVLLGSMNKVTEDMKLIALIREAFSALKDSSASHISTPITCNLQSSLHSTDTSTRSLDRRALLEYQLDLDETINKSQFISSPMISSLQEHRDGSCCAISPTVRPVRPVGSISNGGQASSVSEGVENPRMFQSSHDRQESVEPLLLSNDRSGRNNSRILKYAACNGVAVDSEMELQNDAEKNMEMEAEFSCLDSLTSSFKYSAGYELHEALGPAFLKQNYPWWWEAEKSEAGSFSAMWEGMESSMLTTSNSGSDHLLEAVVANFCSKDISGGRGKMFSTPAESLLTTEKMPEPSSATNNTVGSACYSIDRSSLLEESTKQHYLNSSDSLRTSNGLSSLSSSGSKEQLARQTEAAKANKKRSRVGESCRARPRDRQLIQDRIKELRELVPNGSKCSIDSLLECTIKHMLFLQSITKHAEKLNNCAKSKICNKDVWALGCSSYEQGSSWAVEVGNQMKVGPIVVENLTTTGQLLIEMMCEDCDCFLEIAEAIKSLSLNILKGTMDGHGKKTWIRFIVEGQNNRSSLHRMDVLWSLVQILQAKAAV
ncbi:hypothetical protein Nepgr_022721 [Nepenthes gracilis]|uniref:BHLH domain-containing protein n=1 Tax=Nepenthes gracilis TaxID=150966 RepID=A0AAD3XYD0_NEPGR|nr:hypothetical protein Nepgr_022721 [Nepenthes gracilis]